jgi:hypothetical protein
MYATCANLIFRTLAWIIDGLSPNFSTYRRLLSLAVFFCRSSVNPAMWRSDTRRYSQQRRHPLKPQKISATPLYPYDPRSTTQSIYLKAALNLAQSVVAGRT